MASFRSGFVACVGRPNVGKSTLINRLVGQKVAIVSDKPQTTRNRIQAVLTLPEAQVIFLDTPGIHKPRHRLGRRMVDTARNALQGVDAVAFLIDGAAGVGSGDRRIVKFLAMLETPVILVVNKLDQVAPERRDETVRLCAETLEAEAQEPAAPETDEAETISEKAEAREERPFRFYRAVGVSALSGDGVDELLRVLVDLLPEGPKYYPDDWVTDHPERFIVAELVREKILHHTHDEVPHAVAVQVERMAPREGKENGLIDIHATIYVERDSQRGIIIGKGGSMLRKVGTEARQEIESLLGSPVNLQLWVKVKRDWRNTEGALQELGYRDE